MTVTSLSTGGASVRFIICEEDEEVNVPDVDVDAVEEPVDAEPATTIG